MPFLPFCERTGIPVSQLIFFEEQTYNSEVRFNFIALLLIPRLFVPQEKRKGPIIVVVCGGNMASAEHLIEWKKLLQSDNAI